MKQCSNLPAYLDEYEKPIMNKLRCKILWGFISEIASNGDNHVITASDRSPLSYILKSSEIIGSEAAYRQKDALNNGIYPVQKRLATLETNFWKLNGDYILPDKNNSPDETSDCDENGWESENLCAAMTDSASGKTEYVFAAPPSITIKFNKFANGQETPLGTEEEVNLVGLHFIFYAYGNEYPTSFDVKIITNQQTYYINGLSADSYSYDLEFPACHITTEDGTLVSDDFRNGITGITQIVITINKWSAADRRARIDELEFGLNKIYDNTTLVNAEETRVLSAVGTELPISTFTFTVLDREMLFDAENPNSLTQFLTTRQPIEVTWIQQTDVGDVSVKSATYYLKEWNDTDSRREYKLTAEDLIGFMEEPYNKGVFTGTEKSVKELVTELFNELFPQSSGLSDKLDCNAIGEDVKITAPLPLKLNNQQCTYKDCFMMLAQIAGCVITTDTEGRIVFKKLPHNYVTVGTETPGTETPGAETPPEQYKIPISVVFDNPPRSNLKSALKQVQVNYYSYQWDNIPKAQLYSGKTILKKNEKYSFELSDGGLVEEITINDIPISLESSESNPYTINCYTYIVELIYNGDNSNILGKEVQIKINGRKLLTSTSVFNSKILNANGEVVTIDVPICSSYVQAQAIANNFIAETEKQEEFELEIKRNVLLECGDVLELEKPVFGSEKYSYIPCRLWENKKSLTKVRQSVKLRKLNFD